MDYHALEKMTVVQLREEAQKHAHAKAVTAMKKAELIELLAEQLGLEKPAKKPKKKSEAAATLDKPALKKKIGELREQRDKARSGNDKKKIVWLGRRIHSLKRRMRKIA